MKLFNSELGAGPTECFADILRSIVDEDGVWKTALLNGFSETIQDTEAPQRLLPLAPTKNSLRDSIQLRVINVSHYAVDEKTDGRL